MDKSKKKIFLPHANDSKYLQVLQQRNCNVEQDS